MSESSGQVSTEHRPIEVLADDVIDQIAAGEVVERPASVVKELVENALDAGATHIAVEIEEGGRRLIRVLDNGIGMTGEQALLALQRHATSKLRTLADLFGLHTMGFRGEALPSIAAVSRMTLVTRTRDQVAATRIEIEAGTVIERSEVGAPVGTSIEVCDLLYNVPARLKFLKGQATEASHITDAVSKLAMAHPRVHFRLRHGKRTAIEAPTQQNPETAGLERARALLGARMGRRLHRVEGEEDGVAVVAYLAAPEQSLTTSRGVQLFVGRRAVRDRGLLHALHMGYGELIPRGRFPVAVLFVDLPGHSVDVNVHPQKLEVRFADAQAVYAAVRHTVARGVAKAPWLADPGTGDGVVRMRVMASSTPPLRSAPASATAADYARKRTRALLPWGRSDSRPAQVSFPLAPPADGAGTIDLGARERSESAPRSVRAGEPAAAPIDPSTGAESSAAATPAPDEPAPFAGFFSGLRYLGQLDRTYLLCEGDGELILLDQHAAHERVEFQRLRRAYQERTVPVQTLLFPQTLSLTPGQAAIAAESLTELGAVGFELEPFGGNSFALKAVPARIPAGTGAAVLEELLDELIDRGGSRAVDERLEAVFATIACHSVVRAGDILSPREVEALLAALDGVDFRAHCPHGRPVLLRISVAEIARRFGR